MAAKYMPGIFNDYLTLVWHHVHDTLLSAGDFTEARLLLSAGNSVQGIIGHDFLILSTLHSTWEHFSLLHAKISGLSQDNDKRPSSASRVVVVSDQAGKIFSSTNKSAFYSRQNVPLCHPHVQK
jgi:hypothetical protein